jgi:aminoglycoside phosphotransferase (APT) family kinase protein
MPSVDGCGAAYDPAMDDSLRRLHALHDARTTPADEVARIVAATTGRASVRCTRIVAGEVNEVYGVALEGGGEVVVRIDHLGIGFAHELWAMGAARDAGVPVAPVVGSDPDASRYVILERLPGRSMLELLLDERPGEERRRRLVEAAGELLARLHTVRPDGYGPIRRGGAGAFPTLDAWLADEFALARYEEPFARTGLPAALLAEAGARLAAAEQVLAPPRLVHRDFGPKHLFVGPDDTLVGLIDFGRVECADPILDFGGWRHWFEGALPLAWLRAGYERLADPGPRFDERLRLAQLLELLHLLRHYAVAQPFPRAAAETAVALRELLA